MKLRVESIPDEGLEISVTKPVAWLTNLPELINGQGIIATGDVKLDFSVSRNGEQLHIEGTIAIPVETECARCLDKIVTEVSAPLDLVLDPAKSGKEIPESEDEGYAMYAGDEIDLSDYIRGQLTLYFPLRFLCKEDCVGLCSKCGANLNSEKCVCNNVSSDPRWAELKKLKF